jgi:alpha-glucosidase
MLLSLSLFVLAALVFAALGGFEGTMADSEVLGPYAYTPEDNPLTGPPGLPIGAVASVRFRPDGADIAAERGTVRITFLADDLVRALAIPKGMEEPDPSHAVVKTDWPPVQIAVSDDAQTCTMRSAAATVSVRKSDGAVTVGFADGETVFADASFAWAGSKPRVTWTVPDQRRFYGCGEKTMGMERRNRPLLFWNNDWAAWPWDADPLYQSVPFVLGMDGGRTHGIFVDNTWRSVWDLGRPGTTTSGVQADGGALDIYVFTAGSPSRVIERFTELVGRMPLPPLWSLGYQQSRYSYYPDSVVRDLAAQFRSRRIPCDVIYFDIHYMDARKVFTWDRGRFPDPEDLIATLRAQGFHSVVIIDPGLKIEKGYAPCDELREKGLAVRQSNGQPLVAKVWPGDCLFPDFTSPACREWWGRQFADLVKQGVSGFWTDMNEPAAFDGPGHTIAPDARFDGGGSPGPHLRYHNVYGHLMARATYEGVRRLRPDTRAWVLTRAAYAGTHRYAAAWTGDNVSNWDHFRVSLPMLMSMGLSGQGFCGPDTGGFVGEPGGELHARWLQAAALFPFCRVHVAATGDVEGGVVIEDRHREPWAFGETYTAVNRASIELRYRLLPYLYTCFEEMTRTGAPVMRPLFFDYPEDPRAHACEDQFLAGRDLLCAPVVHEGAETRTVYLPAGAWYDFHTGHRYEGGRSVEVEAPLQRLPLFVRAGAALPTQPVIQCTDESATVPLVFRVYIENGQASGEAYEDDGASMAYERGIWCRTRVGARVEGGKTVISAKREGKYTSPRPAPRYEVIGGPPPVGGRPSD